MNSLSILFLMVFVANPSNAAEYLKKQTAEFEFIAKAVPGGVLIRGKGDRADLKITENGGALSGTIEAHLDSLDTGIELRNSHMRDNYLEVGKFPNATFTFSSVSKETNRIRGTLTLHGKTLPVEAVVKIRNERNQWEMELETELNYTDFGIKRPEFMGIHVDETVKIALRYRGDRS